MGEWVERPGENGGRRESGEGEFGFGLLGGGVY